MYLFCYSTASIKFEELKYSVAENNGLVHPSVILQDSDHLGDNSVTVEVITYSGTATGEYDILINTHYKMTC